MALLEEVIEVHSVNGLVGLPLQALVAPEILSPIAVAAAQVDEIVVAGLKQTPKSKHCILREDFQRPVHAELAVVEVNLSLKNSRKKESAQSQEGQGVERSRCRIQSRVLRVLRTIGTFLLRSIGSAQRVLGVLYNSEGLPPPTFCLRYNKMVTQGTQLQLLLLLWLRLLRAW